VGTDLLERSGERLDVGVRQVTREVLFDSVPVEAPRALHHLAALVGENDEDRAAVGVRADAADEAGLFESIDDAREAALAVQDPFGELVHA